MIAYASRTGTRRNLDALREAGWRLLVSATGAHRTEGFRFCVDCGAWTAHKQRKPFDVAAFERVLGRLGAQADFVILPDIVGGGLASLAFSLEWLPRVLTQTSLALLAVQEGMTPDDVRPHLGERVGIFIGGADDRWKEQTAETWGRLGRAHGCGWVHMGRVNSARRIAICAHAGLTSFDGTSATRYVKTLPPLDRARRQMALFGGVS